MNESLIKDIATAIVNQSILLNWRFYALILLLTFAGSSIAHFLKSYLGKRGEALATKRDFDELLKQQQKLTETTENIKQSVDLSHWKQKEYNLIKRQKIEELLLHIYQYQEWLHLEMKGTLLHIGKNSATDPYPKIIMTYKLYLPEIKNEMDVFINARTAFYDWLVQGMEDINSRITPANLKPTASNEHMKKYGEYYNAVVFTIPEIENACKKIMETIICT